MVLWEKESDNAYHIGYLCPLNSYSKFTPSLVLQYIDFIIDVC